MQYVKIEAPVLLKPWVKCFYHWKGFAEEPVTVQSPPNCFGAIVFNFGNVYQAFQGDAVPEPVPQDFVCGLLTSNYQLTLQGEIDITGVVFYPNAIHNFFGTRMSMLVNNRMDLSLLLGPVADDIKKQLAQQTDSNRIDTLQKALEKFIPSARSRLSVIDDAIEFINEKNGLIEVSDVADKFSISKRYLEKQFIVKVGVSPKQYARLRRFVAISIPVAHSSEMDWQAVVEKFGLYDQSHLIKEFIRFNQMTPQEYIKNHHEMARLLKVKHDQP